MQFGKTLEVAQKGADGFAEQMDAFSVAYFRFAKKYSAHFEVMFNSQLEAVGGGSRKRPGVCHADRHHSRSSATGEVRPGDPAPFRSRCIALVHAASMLQRDRAESQFIHFCNKSCGPV